MSKTPVDIFEGISDAWMDDALCAQTDPEAWFPEQGCNVRPAKATCQRCEVREECLQSALDRREPYGIYGGLTERERRPLLKAASA